MLKLLRYFPPWLPAIVMLVAIFVFSSIPSNTMPHFNWADLFVKKSGHMLGYGLLALAFLYGFKLDPSKSKFAWLFALLYAMTDEFHQHFVPGRHASWVDIIIDSTGAALALIWVKKSLQVLDFRRQVKDS